MDTVELKTMPRDKFGKEAAKIYRNQGLIPVIVYGKGKEVKHALVKENELQRSLNTESHAHVIFNLGVNDKEETAIIQHLDTHPVTGLVRHVDFLNIDMNTEIETEIDIKLVGISPGVKEGGTLDQRIKKLTIKCLPKHLPQHFNIDISGLHSGDVLRAGDIKSENIVVTSPVPEKIIVMVHKPKGTEE